MKKTIIYLTRHGQTEENATGIFQGQSPGHLSKLGKEQAKELRGKIANLEFETILCSDLQRCRDTAAIAFSECSQPIAYLPLIRERDLGNLTGKKIAGATLNETVENDEAVRKRAEDFLELLRRDYAGKRIVVLSHGFFCRVLQGVIEGKSHREIALMDNCEIREFHII